MFNSLSRRRPQAHCEIDGAEVSWTRRALHQVRMAPLKLGFVSGLPRPQSLSLNSRDCRHVPLATLRRSYPNSLAACREAMSPPGTTLQIPTHRIYGWYWRYCGHEWTGRLGQLGRV